MGKKTVIYIISISFLILFFFASCKKVDEISVYDDDDQYLGILVTFDYNYIRVFVPSTGYFVRLSSPECDVTTIPIVFETFDCTGTAYFQNSVTPVIPLYPSLQKACTGSYFILQREEKTVNINSILESGCTCATTSLPNTKVLELVPTSAPPFTLPASLPLRYE